MLRQHCTASRQSCWTSLLALSGPPERCPPSLLEASAKILNLRGSPVSVYVLAILHHAVP